MTAQPSLSIVTPSFNQGRFIRRTIESVLSQGVPVEYFVADGGSSDDTTSILTAYGDALRFVSEPDRGQAHAVNKGARATSGEIIGWLNSDDVYLPGAFAVVLDHFERNPATQVLYGRAVNIDEADAMIDDYPTEPWNFARLCQACFISQPAVFFRRSLFERLGGLDETLQYGMDYELWLRWGSGIPFVHLPARLAGSRVYADNKTFSKRLEVHREIISFLARYTRVSPVWIGVLSSLELERAGCDLGALFGLPFLLQGARNFLKYNRRLDLADMKALRDHLRWRRETAPTLPAHLR